MTSTHHKQARTAAHLGCAAAAGYAVLKAAWSLGSTFGVRDIDVFEDFVAGLGGPLVAGWATVLLALLAGAILQSLVQPWGRRLPRRLRASLAWAGFATMTPIGLLSLGGTVAGAAGGATFPMLTPAVYIYVYACFVVLGLSFATAAWRTRDPAARPASPPPPSRSPRSRPSLTHRWEHR